MWSARHRSGPPRPATPSTVRTPNLLNRSAVVGDHDFLGVCWLDGCVAGGGWGWGHLWVGGVGQGWVFFYISVQALVLPTSLWIHVTSQGNFVSRHIASPVSLREHADMKLWHFDDVVNELLITAFWRCFEWVASRGILNVRWTSCQSRHFESVVNELPIVAFWRCCEWVTNCSILKVLWTSRQLQHFEGVVNKAPIMAFWRCCEWVPNHGILKVLWTSHQSWHFECVVNESPTTAFFSRCQRCTLRWFAGWCRHCYDWPPTRRVTPMRLLRWRSWAVCLFRSFMKMPSNYSSHCIPSPTMSPCEC